MFLNIVHSQSKSVLCKVNTVLCPGSCGGRCGDGYYRGSLCQCDYECLSLNECCTDFTQSCTTSKVSYELSSVAVTFNIGIAFDVNVISTGVVYILCNSL